MTAVAFADEDEAYTILAEAFGLLACVPDLALYESVGSGGPDDHGNIFPDATLIGVGQLIGGAIDYGGDVDLFEFAGNAGLRYQVDVSLGSLEDSVLTIYDADGWEVAYNDDYGSRSASRIEWEVPATEFYYIEVSGFGLATGSYTLILEPFEVTDDYPDSPDLVLPSIMPGEFIEGAIDHGGDVDWFELSAVAGQSYQSMLPWARWTIPS